MLEEQTGGMVAHNHYSNGDLEGVWMLPRFSRNTNRGVSQLFISFLHLVTSVHQVPIPKTTDD